MLNIDQKERSLNRYLATRQWKPYRSVDAIRLAKDHRPFLDRLNFMKSLPVHDGCVNTICWNKTGEYILSGSDDCNLCITKPTYLFDDSKDYSVLHKVPTRHLGNIFSAQFMPNSGDSLIVSCSSEGPVIVHDFNSQDPSEGILNYNCHSSTIYEVVPVPDDDKVFLSCGEDKTIRLFDIRVHASCARSGTCPHPALIRNSSAMTTLSLHPLNSNLVLVGRADGIGLVYDRRMLPDVSKFSREKAHADRLAGKRDETFTKYMHPLEGVVSQFTVPDIDEKYRFTSLCYNANGSEVLASYSGDYVYLFNHDKSSNIELIQTLPKKQRTTAAADGNNNSDDTTSSTQDTSDERQRRDRTGIEITRFRVRGDWSDTGVNSVPHSRLTRRDRSNQDEPSQANTFWQHMADVAFSLSTRRASGERTRFVPITEILALSSPRSNNTSTSNNDSDDDDEQPSQDRDDENSTVVDEEEEEEEMDHDDILIGGDIGDDDDYETLAEMTVERVVNDATEHVANRSDTNQSDEESNTSKMSRDRSESNDDDNQRPKVSAQTKMKFKRTLDNLKSKYNQIPTHHPHVKYQGHRNSRTSIKEAIFWSDDYIMSGSDCGRIIVWEKKTAKIVMGFPADDRVVNCLAPNPYHYALASSGIDYNIKLWSTQGLLEGPLKVSDKEMANIVENNELMLEESKQTISVPPHLFFRVLASLSHIRSMDE